TGGGNGTGGSGTTGGTTPDGGGAAPQEQGTSALTDTGESTNTAPQGNGNGKELAETGAGETTFLLIGAATMIAGGIGFRVLPRVMAGRDGAAA
ncbi:hypothetical protein G3I51_01605, partial [Streptomyces sp. SID9944]|nr:hypothetical protein [Streptomyces sp. SID9944]